MPEIDDREYFLAQAHVAILTTLGPGSRLHAMPVWYLYEDGSFTILTTRGSQKHRNIERHQDVTLVVDRRELPYYAVMVQGKATIEAASLDLRRRMATRYLGADRGAAYTARTAHTDSVSIRLRPERFIEYRGEAGRE